MDSSKLGVSGYLEHALHHDRCQSLVAAGSALMNHTLFEIEVCGLQVGQSVQSISGRHHIGDLRDLFRYDGARKFIVVDD